MLRCVPKGESLAGIDTLKQFWDSNQKRAVFQTSTPPLESDICDEFLAGAAEVDITPPPGMPKAGYSTNAKFGSGFRTRLKARVLHLRKGNSSIAIVFCDLLGGSSVVQRLIAEEIAGSTDLNLDGIFMGATHTHAGPGQFLGSDFYNRFASNRPGFDPRWTHFLASQISAAVIEAVENRQPAKVAFGSTEVWGSTRNRSLVPHVQNKTVTDSRTEPQRKFIAINPLLHLIRVDTAGGRPLAAMVIFSVHGTGVSMKSPVYNADIWGYLCGQLRIRILEATGVRAVVGAIEGTHADVAPAIRPRLAGHLEAERVGREIGKAASRLFLSLEPELSSEVTVGSFLREVDLDHSSTVSSPLHATEAQPVKLAVTPAVGAALVAGAHENTTPVIHRIPPFRPGNPKPWKTEREHGRKWVLGGPIQRRLFPTHRFPRVLPIHLLQIGKHAIVGLPFEVTVEAGKRVRRSVAAALDSTDITNIAVSSVVNEYCGYMTTPEEYDRQHYEGGHTLYGPNTLEFVAAHAHLAAIAFAEGAESEFNVARKFDLKLANYMPTPGPHSPPRRAVKEPFFVDATRTENQYWEFRWSDVPPGDLHWHERLVTIESSRDGGAWAQAVHRGLPICDEGWDIEISVAKQGSAQCEYRVRWYDPHLQDGLKHRIVVVGNSGRPELHSEPFD